MPPHVYCAVCLPPHPLVPEHPQRCSASPARIQQIPPSRSQDRAFPDRDGVRAKHEPPIGAPPCPIDRVRSEHALRQRSHLPAVLRRAAPESKRESPESAQPDMPVASGSRRRGSTHRPPRIFPRHPGALRSCGPRREMVQRATPDIRDLTFPQPRVVPPTPDAPLRSLADADASSQASLQDHRHPTTPVSLDRPIPLPIPRRTWGSAVQASSDVPPRPARTTHGRPLSRELGGRSAARGIVGRNQPCTPSSASRRIDPRSQACAKPLS